MKEEDKGTNRAELPTVSASTHARPWLFLSVFLPPNTHAQHQLLLLQEFKIQEVKDIWKMPLALANSEGICFEVSCLEIGDLWDAPDGRREKPAVCSLTQEK